MSNIYTIKNEYLSVSVSAQGAELQSIRDAGGHEYLWQADPTYWGEHAPNLFPYVGRLLGGEYKLDGEIHRMEIHGLALYLPFTLAAHTGDSMTFQLESSSATKAKYPRDFAFRIHYTLEGNRLNVDFEVENRDEKTMYYGLGGHPGFRVPMEEGKAFEDYRLRFPQECHPFRVTFGPNCLRSGTVPYALEENRILSLRHDLFDDDAIVLGDLPREVTLETESGSRSVTVRYPNMPYLGMWHWPKTDAPYVCLEPWGSLPAREGEIMVFEEQEDLFSLAPGETSHNSWSIEIQ